MTIVNFYQRALLLTIALTVSIINTIATLKHGPLALIATIPASLILSVPLIAWQCRGYLYYLLTRISVRKVITRGSDDTPYLVRYTILKNKYFSLKVHQILISDDACLHNHPWAYLTVLLRGSYTEETFFDNPIIDERVQVRYGPGSVLYRPAKHYHRLIVNRPVWTLFVTFRRSQEWGFMVKKKGYTFNSFVIWNRYEYGNRCE